MKIHVFYIVFILLLIICGYFVYVHVDEKNNSDARINARLYYSAGIYAATKMEAKDERFQITEAGLSDVRWHDPDAPSIDLIDNNGRGRTINFVRENGRYVPASDSGFLPMPVSVE